MKSSLGGCGSFVKYSIFLINFIIFIAGLVVVGLGIWVLTGASDIKEVLHDTLLNSSAIILLSFGGVVSIIAFLGCCGAIKEVKCLLLTFFIILLLITILTVAGVVVAVKLQGKAEGVIVDALTGTLKEYNSSSAVHDAWNGVQEKLHCCGVQKLDDWRKHDMPVPSSCLCDEECKTTYWDQGCYGKILEEIKHHSKPLIISGVFLAVVTIISMVFSCSLYLML